jgi:hypothetical protein
MNTAATSSNDRSASVSRLTLHSTVARSVCWRSGRSTGPVPSASSDRASRPSSSAGSSSRVRAAASSMASGSPSRRRPISATASAFSSVRAKPGRTARARSTNSATVGEASSADTPEDTLAGSASGGTGYSRSARSPSTVRLVATIVIPGQRASSSPKSRAIPTTCSRLSRISSQAPSPNVSASASSGEPAPARSAPAIRPIAASTSSGLVIASSGTNTVPAPKRSPSRSPTATASRVLPMPPGPVSVTSRAPERSTSPATSSMARSRPSSDVVLTGSGRGPRAPAGGDTAAAAWPPAAANRSLSSTARSSRTSRPSSAGVRKFR